MKTEPWFDAQGRPTRAAREVYATALLSNTVEELPGVLLEYARAHPEFEAEVMALVQVLRLRRATPPRPPRPSLRGVLTYAGVLLVVLSLVLVVTHLLRQPATPQRMEQPVADLPAADTLPETPAAASPQPDEAPPDEPAPAAPLQPAERLQRAHRPQAPARDSAAFVPDTLTEKRLLKFAFGQPRELHARSLRSGDFLAKKSSSVPALILTCDQVGRGLPVRVRCTCTEHPLLDGQQVWTLKIYSNRREKLLVRELTLRPNFEIEIGGGEGPGLYYWTLLTPESDGRVAWEGRYLVN